MHLKEILNGFIKLRLPLGMYLKSTGFRSLLDHWKCTEVSSLSSFLWMISERNVAMFDVRLGNELNFLRVECDFSKLPKFQMLTEAYQRYPGLVRWKSGVKCTQMCRQLMHILARAPVNPFLKVLTMSSEKHED